MDVGIIGGGFWGCAIARKLTEQGITCTVIDDANPSGASRNAAGICKLSWYRQDTVAKMISGVFTYDEFMNGFNWLREQVAIAQVPERFVNAPRGTSRQHIDNFLADPADLLRYPTYPARVDKFAATPSGVEVIGPELNLSFDTVIVCAGAATDQLLDASGLGKPTGVRGLLGRAILFGCDDYDRAEECMTVMTRPYVHYTFRKFRGRMRGGDTVERRRDDGRVQQLVATALGLFTGMESIETVGGVRPVCQRMFVGPVAPRVLAATGGHRVGFGLAGAVAERIRSLLA